MNTLHRSSQTKAAQHPVHRFVANLALASAAAAGAGGCSDAKQGAVTGAGVGALSGLAIGSLSGNAGQGAAIGAIVGGVGGAVIGDQNRRQEEAAAAAASKTPPTSPQPAASPAAAPAPTQTVVVVPSSPQPPPRVTVMSTPYETGAALGRMVGEWQVSGTIDAGSGETLLVSGAAHGVVENTYFLRLDIKFHDPRTGGTVVGTSIISQAGGRTVEMTNAFSSSPQVKRFRGNMDAGGSAFDLAQIDPPSASRRIMLRLTPDGEMTADAWEGSRRLESYTFTKP